MRFAIDPRTADMVKTWLNDLASSSSPAPQWALVDVALVDAEKVQSVLRQVGWAAHNALGASVFASFDAVAPQLFALPKLNAREVAALMRLQEIDSKAPAISLIELAPTMAHTSAQALNPLLQLFAYLSATRVDGDLDLHCRFADTRVLPHLLNALAAPQIQRLGQVVSGWHWLGRDGAPVVYRVPPQVAEADPNATLQLSAAQFAQVMDGSEADTTFVHLLETTPEVVPRMPGHAAFHGRLVRILQTASTRALQQPNDRIQFVVLSLSFGEYFYQNPVLQDTWRAIAQGKARLTELSANWSDATWDALEAAKPKEPEKVSP
jgi:hypothetical protein